MRRPRPSGAVSKGAIAGPRRTVLCALIVSLLGAAQPAAAHVPQLRGRLIELVGQSDLIVVGTVENVRAVATRQHDTTIRLEGHLLGTTPAATVTVRARPRFAPGKRFVFFLRRAGAGLECVQPSGAVFPSRPEDDAAYRATITAIQQALRARGADRPAALRAALIPALSAAAPPLRYHAVLELGALSHHGLTGPERRSLERLAADPATDPAIRPVLTSLIRGTAEPQP
jgi:hypothetical protein